MNIIQEIKAARTEISSDGYEMSVGELINLYRDEEIIIDPAFQRLFRWDISRKTRFIESILLNIPTPPLFVYQKEGGVWELIDGLQRFSTILEFVGLLKDSDGRLKLPSVLEGTKFLPSLNCIAWDKATEGAGHELPPSTKIELKRTRIRVEILKSDSDPSAKYELFQRLNTGGAQLTPQEVRNCVSIMINPSFHSWIVELSAYPAFVNTIDQTAYATEQQMAVELAFRFIAFRNIPYQPGLDVHEYLDEATITVASNTLFDFAGEKKIFEETFELLNSALGDKAFKKWNGQQHSGKFLMSLFEVVSTGLATNLATVKAKQNPEEFIQEACRSIWDDPDFTSNSGAGVRGTTRLAKLLPIASRYFS